MHKMIMMKIKYPVFLVFVLAINLFANSQDTNLVKLLPVDSDFECLNMTSEIESYIGDELFFLINGGADLYLEYGFVQVVSADYSNEAGSSMHIEIFEMKDRPAAYGIYTLQHMRDDDPDEIGEKGQIIKNNALMIKDRYVVKMHAKFPEDRLQELLKTTADLISSRIIVKELKPLLLPFLLPMQDNDFPQVRFIRGPIALRNIFYFHSEDIFNVDDGVVGIYQDYTIFIFQYPGSLKAIQQFNMARSQFEKSDRYSSFFTQKNQFQMIDNKGNKIQFHTFDEFIVGFVYQGNRNLTPLIQEIKFNIDLSF